jgi:hypothetical protein
VSKYQFLKNCGLDFNFFEISTLASNFPHHLTGASDFFFQNIFQVSEIKKSKLADFGIFFLETYERWMGTCRERKFFQALLYTGIFLVLFYSAYKYSKNDLYGTHFFGLFVSPVDFLDEIKLNFFLHILTQGVEPDLLMYLVALPLLEKVEIAKFCYIRYIGLIFYYLALIMLLALRLAVAPLHVFTGAIYAWERVPLHRPEIQIIIIILFPKFD